MSRYRSMFIAVVGIAEAWFAGAAFASAAPGDGGSPGNGIHGRNGSGKIAVSGTASSTTRSRQEATNPARSVAISCTPTTQKQLTGLGDLDPAITAQTCADQALVCKEQSRAQKRTLDPVVQVDEQADGTWQYGANTCATNGPAAVTAAAVREQAVRLVPSAAVGLAPHGSTLVNIETVMWADAPRQQEFAPVTIVGQSVVIRLVLDHVAWDFGDGDSDQSGPAGKRYDAQRDPCRSRTCPTYYGHVYSRTGSMTVRATASWRASFSVAGGAPMDIPGVVTGPASMARIVVKQARGVLVPNPGESP